MGFPEWSRVSDWLNKDVTASYPPAPAMMEPEIKNLEVPELESYEVVPEESFWKSFPKRELPDKVTTRVNVLALRRRISAVKNRMSRTELNRAKRVLRNLREGASAFQKSELPPISTKNSKSAAAHGRVLTDTIATWVKKGFVAGPFVTPPVQGFRANPLGVVVRSGKVRPILNMSGPVGRSFNDNVNEKKLERLHMGTAKQFGQLLLKSGEGALFSKFDIQDAYKLIPARREDYRLQGFEWLGRYFIETRMSFGGKPSPPNFDGLARTKDLVVCLESGMPRCNVTRALDDSPCIASEAGLVEKFTKEMKDFCEETNIPLASNCPNHEKAFEMKQRGTVLGVGFDSVNSTWHYSEHKADKVVRRCLDGARALHLSLLQIQKIMGSVNDMAQMCPLLKSHQRSGNAFITKFGGDNNLLRAVPIQLRRDLEVVAKVAESTKSGLPIAETISQPGLAALTFYTDAAGASFTVVGGKRCFHDNVGKGAACIGGTSLEDIWGWTRVTWPDGLLTSQRDEKGCFFGSKSTTLESIGVLLPFITYPKELRNRQLVFRVDNTAVLWGWKSGYVSNDATATEILKCVRYLAGFLGARVFIEHVDRMSTEIASLADEMSRRDTSRSDEGRMALGRAEFRTVEGFLLEWLKNPCDDQDLCCNLLKNVQE